MDIAYQIQRLRDIRSTISGAVKGAGYSDASKFSDFTQCINDMKAETDLQRLLEGTCTEYYDTNNISVIGDYAFAGCSNLTTVSFPACKTIDIGAFAFCSNLTTAYFMASQVCTLGTSAFNGCSNLTSIYVPASLVDQYKVATNWSQYSTKIIGY